MSNFVWKWSLLGMALRESERLAGNRWVMLQSPGANAATIGAVLMIAIHFGVWAIYFLFGEAAFKSVYYEWGGLSWVGLASGRVWQLVTHIFLHGSLMHLVINVLLYYYAAARLSHFMSGRRIMGLFLLCGVGSGLAHVLMQAFFPALHPLVGASGGLTGLLLGFFSISPESRMLLLNISAGNLAKGVLIASAFLFVISPALNLPVVSNLGEFLEVRFGKFLFQAGHFVHFIGGLMGWGLIAKFLPKLLSRNDLVRMRLEEESQAACR